MSKIDKKRLETIISRFSENRIMVVGDIMLDEYMEGTVDRISPEAPIPVVNLTTNRDRDIRLGGAANVFSNLVSLGGKEISLCGVIGNDTDGKLAREKISSMGADAEGLILDKDRPTIVKTRIIAHNQQVIRLDREESKPISKNIRQAVAGYIKEKLDSLDAIIFSDYEKGVITKNLLEEILPLAAEKGVFVAVDPKFTNFRYFKGATIIVPNRKEASGFVRHEIVDDSSALKAAQNIMESLKSECVLVKLSERGMLLLEKDGSHVFIETVAEQVYDVTGAGDTVISTLMSAKTAGATWEEAARIANFAAGVVIHYIGTSVIKVDQLKSAILENRFPTL